MIRRRKRFNDQRKPMIASQLTMHADRGYRLLTKYASLPASPLLLLVRVYWGLQFFGTGKGKLMDIPKVAAFLADKILGSLYAKRMIAARQKPAIGDSRDFCLDPHAFVSRQPPIRGEIEQQMKNHTQQ